MHPQITQAFNTIDAAVFSGDTFHSEDALREFRRMLERWNDAIPVLEEMVALAAQEEDD